MYFCLQQRREKDEFRITELKTEMSRLDSDLTVEIKRRTEMNKSTQIVRNVVFLELLLTTLTYGFRFCC